MDEIIYAESLWFLQAKDEAWLRRGLGGVRLEFDQEKSLVRLGICVLNLS